MFDNACNSKSEEEKYYEYLKSKENFNKRASSKEQKAILVPTNSIIPDDKNKQIVVVKNGKAAFVNVETGGRQANNIEITKGLKTGDSVVVTGLLFARPKSQLKVRAVKTLEQLAN